MFFAVLFFALIMFLGYFLIFDAESTINNTYNRRASSLSEKVIRGNILSADGELLAGNSTNEAGEEVRVYPYGSLFAHAVGFIPNGSLGLESSYNYYMLTSHADIIDKLRNEFHGTKDQGDTIITTLEVGLQERLSQILSGNEGAIIVMDPETGAVLGMYSSPGFDPNTIEEDWEYLEDGALVNRATQSRLTPGSTFKIFTLLEYYRQNGSDISDYTYECTGSIETESGTIHCAGGTAHGTVDAELAFAYSCNCAFVDMGLSLDIAEFAKDSTSMLFGTELPIDIAYNQSTFTLDETSTEAEISQTVFGQGDTQVSPLHLALITSAIANDGVLMKARLVSGIMREGGSVVRTFDESEYGRVFSEEEAAFLKECMKAVTEEGTASSESWGNYEAYGKTGTAETGDHERSWFTGFAESDGKTVVVCAMIENRYTTGLTGARAARLTFDYIFG